jgi:hypothetical protein
VLDHADTGDRVERLVSELAVVGDANLDLVLEARVGDQPRRASLACGGDSVTLTT